MDAPHSNVPSLTHDAITTWLGSNAPTDVPSSAFILQLISDARPLNPTTHSSNVSQVVVSDGRHYVPALFPRTLLASMPGPLLRRIVRVNRATWVPVKVAHGYKKLPIVLQCDTLSDESATLACPTEDRRPQRVPSELVDLPEQWEPDRATPGPELELSTIPVQLEASFDSDACSTTPGLIGAFKQDKPTSAATATSSVNDCPSPPRPLSLDRSTLSPALPPSITIDALPAYSTTGNVPRLMHVRITRKSELVQASNARGTRSFDADLADSTGTIRAVSYDPEATILFTALVVGRAYCIEGARLRVQGTGRGSAKGCLFEVHLGPNARIASCEHSVNLPPPVSKPFVSLAEIAQIPLGRSVDILVVVHEDEGPNKGSRPDGTQYINRRLHLFDETAGPVILTLWGSATDFMVPTGNVCAIKSVKVAKFRNATSMSSTALTSLSIEPDTTWTAALRLWYAVQSSTLPKVVRPRRPPLHLTIGEVMVRAMEGVSTALDTPFRFMATIVQVDCHRYGYLQCDRSDCRKRVRQHEKGYLCCGCNNAIENPQFAYMLHITVVDPSGSLHLVVFSAVAERLVGIPSSQVVALLERQQEPELLSALEDMRGRQYWMVCIAKARQSNYLPDAHVQYQLSSFSEPDYHHEIEQARQDLQAALSEGLL